MGGRVELSCQKKLAAEHQVLTKCHGELMRNEKFGRFLASNGGKCTF